MARSAWASMIRVVAVRRPTMMVDLDPPQLMPSSPHPAPLATHPQEIALWFAASELTTWTHPEHGWIYE